MNIDLERLERESDIRTQKQSKKARTKEIATFDAESDLEHLPYDEPNLIFERQGTRIIWISRGDRYCSTRYYPNEDTAKQVMELLKERRKQ